MAEYTATFETGVHGNAVLNSDAGSATAWETVNDPANVTLTYSNVQKYGTLSCLITCDATGNAGYCEWSTGTISPAYSGTHYGRMYLFFPSLPGTNTWIARGFSAAGTLAWGVRLTTAGILALFDAGSTQRAVFTNAIATNQWIRFEYKVVQSTSAGVLEGKLFNSPDSASATETATSTGSFSVLADTGRLRFGNVAGAVPNLSMYMDNILSNDTGYPGPVSTGTAIQNPNTPHSALAYYYG